MGWRLFSFDMQDGHCGMAQNERKVHALRLETKEAYHFAMLPMLVYTQVNLSNHHIQCVSYHVNPTAGLSPSIGHLSL